jgi:hypothetical protein
MFPAYNNSINQNVAAFFSYKPFTWKGTGVNRFPVGTTYTNIRPLTNNDPGNAFPAAFGRARPIKHYRKGRVFQITKDSIPTCPPLEPEIMTYKTFSLNSQAETDLVGYNMVRYSKSSRGASLGGGSGGAGVLSLMIDKPGSFSLQKS